MDRRATAGAGGAAAIMSVDAKGAVLARNSILVSYDELCGQRINHSLSPAQAPLNGQCALSDANGIAAEASKSQTARSIDFQLKRDV